MLGIDPGSHRAGFAILDQIDRSKPSVIQYGTIESPPNTIESISLIHLRKELKSIIEEFNPEIASVEDLFFSKNIKTASKVFQARGVILLTLAEANIKIIEPTVTQIKKGITGSGNADKKQIKLALKLFLGIKDLKGHDDSWDAIAAGFVGLSMI
jgi:crossover junction endodeoxyribonuclease RuvC